MEGAPEGLVLKQDERLIARARLQPLKAPVEKGQEVGRLQYLLGEEVVREDRLLSAEEVKRIDYGWCLKQIIDKFLF